MNLRVYLVNDWDKVTEDAKKFDFDLRALGSFINGGTRKSDIHIEFFVTDSELFSKMIAATDDYVTAYIAYRALEACSKRVQRGVLRINDINLVNLVRWVNTTYKVNCNKYDTNLPQVW